MSWSFKLGRLAGIDVRVHATFLLLLLWVGWSRYALEGTMTAAVQGMIFIILLFSIVVLHELGHALTARRFGIPTRDITLLPIGGVARLERMPEDPKQELAVAVAGPAVNVFLALLLGLVLWASDLRAMPVEPIDAVDGNHGFSLLAQLMWANVALAVFNLLPAFPMDGGRALRALLAMRMKPARATQLAAGIGQTLAMGLGLIGLFTSPVLILIAVFVWLGAAGEARLATVRSALHGIPVADAMVPRVQVLAPDDPLAAAAEITVHAFQHDFPVVQSDGQVVGMLSRRDLIRGLAEHGPGTPVGAVMHTTFEVAHPHDMLDKAMERLEASPCPAMPVVHRGMLVGLLSTETLGELISIRRAVTDNPRPLSPRRL